MRHSVTFAAKTARPAPLMPITTQPVVPQGRCSLKLKPESKTRVATETNDLERSIDVLILTFDLSAVCTGTAPATAATAIAVSFVPNSYFSFPYAPTTYDNRDICTSAASACSKNYDTCVTVLEGGSGWGVTIAVPGGGGTTVAGGAAGLGASATPICSSLSSRACSNLEATPCSSYDESDSSTTRTNLKLLTVGAILVMLNLVS